MTQTLPLNTLPTDEAEQALLQCCASKRWVQQMMQLRPFSSVASLLSEAHAVWAQMGPADLLEAFAGHPRIGESLEALRSKFVSTSAWSESEQAGLGSADDALLLELQRLNAEYEARFGFIFIVCATGKSAQEMVDLLKRRLLNEPAYELEVAAMEQAQILVLRLEKLQKTGTLP